MDADHYRKNSAVQMEAAQRVMSIHRFSGNEKVLDIGCGEGRVTIELAKHLPNGSIDAVDPSPEMIKLASDTYNTTHPQVHFSLGSGETVHAVERYDLVTAFSSLHWVRDPIRCFGNILHALVPGGHALILSWDKAAPYFQLFSDLMKQDKWSQYYEDSACAYWLTPYEYFSLVKQIGFIPLVTLNPELLTEYANKQAYIEFVRGWISCLGLPKQREQEYLNELGDLAVERFATKGKKQLKIPHTQVILHLQRPS